MAARRAAPISTKNSPSAEPPGRIAAGALIAFVAGLLLACVLAGSAFAASSRTIVVRGRALTSKGEPVVGARVQVRGSASVMAMTDGYGRYVLSVPLGMPGALREQPFKLEVRAEGDGHRLKLAGGGESLVLDAWWDSSRGVVLVKSNREAVARSVAAAIETGDVTVAAIEADFGGVAGANANGSFLRQAALPSSPPVEGAAAEQAAPAPRDSAAAGVAAQALVPAAADTGAAVPSASANVPSPAPAAAATGAAVPTATGAAVPTASASVPSPAPASASPAGTKSPTGAAAVPAATSMGVPAGAPSKSAPFGWDTLRIGDPAAAATPSGVPSSPAGKPLPGTRAARAAQVRAISALAGPDSLAPKDSCHCSVRGTVEIDWTRPLEDHTSVRLELDAPGAPSAEVSLFMGAPREFRFGPLPCGAWRLTVKAMGKLRYTDVRGKSPRIIPCAGMVETRVVLVPAKR